jgi:predicted transcriptional regulator
VSVHEYESQNTQGNPVQPAKNDLLNLLTDGKFTQAEICNQLSKSRSTVSRQIHQLEAAGLVERMPDGKWHAKGGN